jgi:hypothetical protein
VSRSEYPWELVITLGRPFTVCVGDKDVTARDGEIVIPFDNRASAEAAARETSVSVRQGRVVIAGEVIAAVREITDGATAEGGAP